MQNHAAAATALTTATAIAIAISICDGKFKSLKQGATESESCSRGVFDSGWQLKGIAEEGEVLAPKAQGTQQRRL
jgi:hypothetical protein